MSKKTGILLVLWVWLLINSVAVLAYTVTARHQLHFQSTLALSQQQLDSAKKRFEAIKIAMQELKQDKKLQLQKLLVSGVTKNELSHVAFLVAAARSDISSLQIALADAEESLSFSKNTLADLKQRGRMTAYMLTPLNTDLMTELAVKRVQVYKLIELQQLRVHYVEDALKIANQRLKILQYWYSQLRQLFTLQSQQITHQELIAQIGKIQQQQAARLQKIADINQRLDDSGGENLAALQQRMGYRLDIFVLQEEISISRLQIFLLQLRNRLRPFIIEGSGVESLVVPEDQSEQTGEIIKELVSMQDTVQRKINLIQAHQKVIDTNFQNQLLTAQQYQKYQAEFNTIVAEYKSRMDELTQFRKQVESYRAQMKIFVQNQFSLKQSLPGLDFNAWVALGNSVLMLPKLLWYSLKDAGIQLFYQLQQLSNFVVYLIALLGLFLIGSWIFLRKTFLGLLKRLEETSRRFSSQVLTVLIHLVRRSLGTVIIILVLLGMIGFFNIDLGVWLFIAVVVLLYRAGALLLRLSLRDAEGNMTSKNYRLYNGLRLILGLGAVFSVLTVLTHTLPVAYEVRVLFNKAFMFLLLALSLLLFRAWSVLPTLLERAFAVRKVYIMSVIHIFCWVLPFTLLSNAIIGLLGYVDLAWLIGKYQAIFLFTVSVYMVLRGVLIDVMDLIHEFLIRHFKAGWLWSQAFVRPVDHILRIILFLVAMWSLVHTYGLDTHPTFVAYFHKIMHLKLISIFGNVLTVPALIGLIAFIAILYWFAKWSREFSFRWLYVQARDIGVRYSLAVFTQYLVVIVGVVIGLQVFGIDLRGLAVVAAAFAAAAGFGLRDVVSNFFSGLMLLFERPFRTGDIVTLGQYEGKVISSGMRSMKIRTSDRTDVIVPNSDMFTKPFVNWTHQDSIVRTVIKVNIQRVDDPRRVQELILALLVNRPAIVADPPPEVFLVEISEALIELEVRYYINLQLETSRARVRSEILFAIWDCFKANGIRAPHQQMDVYLEDKNN